MSPGAIKICTHPKEGKNLSTGPEGEKKENPEFFYGSIITVIT
jgi:hypothetical protein